MLLDFSRLSKARCLFSVWVLLFLNKLLCEDCRHFLWRMNISEHILTPGSLQMHNIERKWSCLIIRTQAYKSHNRRKRIARLKSFFRAPSLGIQKMYSLLTMPFVRPVVADWI